MLKKSKADYKKDLKDSGFQSSKLEYIKAAEKKQQKTDVKILYGLTHHSRKLTARM